MLPLRDATLELDLEEAIAKFYSELTIEEQEMLYAACINPALRKLLAVFLHDTQKDFKNINSSDAAFLQRVYVGLQFREQLLVNIEEHMDRLVTLHNENRQATQGEINVRPV